ncbi:MAG: DoxX family protein [Bacteroidetes bacterium]|nr:DoxX family protein [Bacteroidota bacterium]
MNKYFIWVVRIIPAVIMLQTLYFKFSAHPESVKLFTILGVEPWGRIGTGVFELIASILLLIPRTTVYGAVLGVGLMCGALAAHLGVKEVGINYGGDPVLFIYALVTFVCCLLLVYLFRNQLFSLLKLKVNG